MIDKSTVAQEDLMTSPPWCISIGRSTLVPSSRTIASASAQLPSINSSLLHPAIRRPTPGSWCEHDGSSQQNDFRVAGTHEVTCTLLNPRFMRGRKNAHRFVLVPRHSLGRSCQTSIRTASQQFSKVNCATHGAGKTTHQFLHSNVVGLS